MKIVFLIILVLLGVYILRKKGEERLYIFLVGILFFPSVLPIPSKGLPSHRFLDVCFLLSIWIHNRKSITYHIPLATISILLLISHLCTGYFDDRISLFSKIWKPIINYINTFLLLYLGYFTSISNRDWNTLLNKISVLINIVCLYGLFTLAIKTDIYANLVSEISGSISDFSPTNPARTRIGSFLFVSHIFAYFCCVWTIIFVYMSLHRKLQKKYIYTLILLSVCLLLSGSRSSLLATFLGIILLIVLTKPLSKILKYTCIGFIFCLPLTQISSVQKKMSFLSDMFQEGGGKTGGSSLSMREQQLDISLYFFNKSPIWGNGFDYFGEVLSDNTTASNSEAKGLLGAESYYFILLIDRGAVQIVLIFLFFLLLTYYFISNKKEFPKENSLALSLLVSFIFVSMVTGNTSKWEYVFPIIGIFLNKNNIKQISKL